MSASTYPTESLDEQARLAALHVLEILDSPPEREFDELVQLAAQICGTPMSAVSLVDADRQWLKASVGMKDRETERKVAFCSHAIEQPDLFLVEDAQEDERFAHNRLVTGAPKIRFYAGLPIEGPGGYRIGTLCVIDVVPRTLTAGQRQGLEILARQVQSKISDRFERRRLARALVDDAQDKVDHETGKRMQAEDSLVALNDLLQSVLESTMDSVMTVDGEWIIRYMNSKASAPQDGRVVGREFWETFPELQGTNAEQHLRRCMRTRQPSQYEIFYGERWFTVLVNASGSGVTLFYRDITEEKVLREQLDRERNLREQRVEALSHMAGGLAHEISNPLAIIHALVSDLRDSLAGEHPLAKEEVQSICEETIETADRAGRILRGLRAFARDGSKEPMQDVPLASVVLQAVELQRQRFERSLIALHYKDTSRMRPAHCRDVQILQIVTNLLSNAFDAIDAANPELRLVQVEVGTSGSQCFVTVVDSGPGVEDAALTHLMTPFFTTKAVGAGLGVGLSLSKAIAEEHKGRLTLQPGRPTCFRLTLPAAEFAEMGNEKGQRRAS